MFDLRPLTDFVLERGFNAVEDGFVERIGDEAMDVIVASIAEAPNLYWIPARPVYTRVLSHSCKNGWASPLRT
jgi:hypothetical protein